MASRTRKREPRDGGNVGWTLQPDGTIDLSVAGAVYTLRAPTIGELRDIELAHAKLNAALQANLQGLAKELTGESGEAAPLDAVALAEAKYERIDLILDWWLDVVWPVLGDEAPPRDALPPWVAVATNTLAALAHWQSTPPGPGGG